MRTYREPAREIEVARDVDVVVVGGGPAGLAAAIAAARCGASTVLVEQFGYLGGTATASLMACINGFRNQVEPDFTQTVRGIAEEIVLQLKEMGGLGASPYPQKTYATAPGEMEYSYAIDTEAFVVTKQMGRCVGGNTKARCLHNRLQRGHTRSLAVGPTNGDDRTIEGYFLHAASNLAYTTEASLCHLRP